MLSSKESKESDEDYLTNALEDGDVKNGDGNVICFCPFMVDYCVFSDRRTKKIKGGVVRLTLDIKKIESSKGYNQFFKLVDFNAPGFDYLVHINKDLSIKIFKGKRRMFTITIILKGESKVINLLDNNQQSKHNMIFYGNLSGINRFCLLSIFNLLAKSNDAQFEEQFIAYLMSLDNNELKKILIVFSQSITVFAEYNFNTAVKNTDNLIQAIHFYNTSQTFQLDTLSKTEYNEAMQLLLIDQQSLNIFPVKKETLISTLENDRDFELYGSTIILNDRHVNFGVRDLTQEPASIYNSGDYVETRIERLYGATESTCSLTK